MPLLAFVVALAVHVVSPPGTAATPSVSAPARSEGATSLPGREADARVAAIGWRLATAGLGRCPLPAPSAGLVFQHLSQFAPADRAGMAAGQALDRGPQVIATVAGAPAAAADVRAGDVLLAVDGAAVPPDLDPAGPFDATRARARADAVDDLVAGSGAPRLLTLLRAGTTVERRLAPRPACPSRIHLARSTQLNAYADGRHVFVTTGLLARLHGDDELAFVLAHEMAHNILGHAALMRGGEVRRGLGRTLGRSGAIVRQAEHDADRLGGELMLDAGYDPVAGAEATRRLGGVELFGGHGGAGERIAAMRRLAAARRGGDSAPR